MTKDDKRKVARKVTSQPQLFINLDFITLLFLFSFMTGKILTDNIKSNKISRPNARSNTLDRVVLSAFVVFHFCGGWHGFRVSRQKGDKGGSVLKMPFMG